MLTTKQMVRIDRAIGGKLMDAVTRAFASSEDKLHDLDVQIAGEQGRYEVILTGLRSEELVAWSESCHVSCWERLDEDARQAVLQIAGRCRIAPSVRSTLE